MLSELAGYSAVAYWSYCSDRDGKKKVETWRMGSAGISLESELHAPTACPRSFSGILPLSFGEHSFPSHLILPTLHCTCPSHSSEKNRHTPLPSADCIWTCFLIALQDKKAAKQGAVSCIFYQKGNCKNGDNCRFVHEKSSSSSGGSGGGAGGGGASGGAASGGAASGGGGGGSAGGGGGSGSGGGGGGRRRGGGGGGSGREPGGAGTPGWPTSGEMEY